MPADPITIRIDLASTTPAYRQIIDALRMQLVAGRVKPGDALPPVRRLAVDLGVHFNTVAEAYRTLAEEGWLELKQGRGVRVLDRRAPAKPASRQKKAFTSRLQAIVAEALSQGIPEDQILRDLRGVADALGRE